MFIAQVFVLLVFTGPSEWFIEYLIFPPLNAERYQILCRPPVAGLGAVLQCANKQICYYWPRKRFGEMPEQAHTCSINTLQPRFTGKECRALLSGTIFPFLLFAPSMRREEAFITLTPDSSHRLCVLFRSSEIPVNRSKCLLFLWIFFDKLNTIYLNLMCHRI